jgi:hypothetical protein
MRTVNPPGSGGTAPVGARLDFLRLRDNHCGSNEPARRDNDRRRRGAGCDNSFQNLARLAAAHQLELAELASVPR